MANGIKRRHEPPRILADLLAAEIAEKQARSIKYQLTIAKLPLAKDLDDFDFAGTPVTTRHWFAIWPAAAFLQPRSKVRGLADDTALLRLAGINQVADDNEARGNGDAGC